MEVGKTHRARNTFRARSVDPKNGIRKKRFSLEQSMEVEVTNSPNTRVSTKKGTNVSSRFSHTAGLNHDTTPVTNSREPVSIPRRESQSDRGQGDCYSRSSPDSRPTRCLTRSQNRCS